MVVKKALFENHDGAVARTKRTVSDWPTNFIEKFNIFECGRFAHQLRSTYSCA